MARWPGLARQPDTGLGTESVACWEFGLARPGPFLHSGPPGPAARFDSSTREEDRIVWVLNTDGCFSSKSAYISVLDQNMVTGNDLYILVWGWQGPERYKIHLWKLAHKALVTNQFRFRRGLAGSGDCLLCGREVESELHLFRDCWLAAQVWCFLTYDRMPQKFYVEDLHTWLRINLKDGSLIRGYKWCLLFVVAISLIWHSRNDFVFNGNRLSGVGIGMKILSQAAVILSCYNDSKLAAFPGIRVMIRSQIRWNAPEINVAKFNVDGAVSRLGETAAMGGVLRNYRGDFLFGFASHLGLGTTIEAELEAILMGITLARIHGQMRVIIESDSLAAVNLIGDGFLPIIIITIC